MIKYNKLQIEGDYLIVDMEVEDYPWYENIIITDIGIATSPDIKDVLIYSYDNSVDVYVDGAQLKRYKFYIPELKDKLIYIIPILSEDSLASIDYSKAPCGSDIVNIGCTYNKNLILKQGINYLKELGNTCNTPKGFIDFILRQKALDLAIKTCNWDAAEKYFNMFLVTKGTTSKGCGCYGK